MTASDYINHLGLLPHPEGGFYKETYRSDVIITNSSGNSRNLSTAIYYLLEGNDRSALHRIQSDEFWFFHAGNPLELVYIEHRMLHTVTLGHDISKGELPQFKVDAGLWFGARVKSGIGFSLVSCTVAPGFDFNDFELADRVELLEAYPHLATAITAFT